MQVGKELSDQMDRIGNPPKAGSLEIFRESLSSNAATKVMDAVYIMSMLSPRAEPELHHWGTNSD